MIPDSMTINKLGKQRNYKQKSKNQSIFFLIFVKFREIVEP